MRAAAAVAKLLEAGSAMDEERQFILDHFGVLGLDALRWLPVARVPACWLPGGGSLGVGHCTQSCISRSIRATDALSSSRPAEPLHQISWRRPTSFFSRLQGSP